MHLEYQALGTGHYHAPSTRNPETGYRRNRRRESRRTRAAEGLRSRAEASGQLPRLHLLVFWVLTVCRDGRWLEGLRLCPESAAIWKAYITFTNVHWENV